MLLMSLQDLQINERVRERERVPVSRGVNTKSFGRRISGTVSVGYTHPCQAGPTPYVRSIASRTCVVTQTYGTFGDRAFSAAGPGLWNSLPSHLKDANLSYNEFWRSLKTFLFGQWGHGAVWTY